LLSRRLQAGGTLGKIFCIGFHKTGTSSIGKALSLLGFRVTGPNFVNDPKIHADLWSLARPLIHEYDAFQDNPWPILFRQVDRYVPGARFILTSRDACAWGQSVETFFGNQSSQMRQLIYGSGAPQGNLERYLRRYRKHYEEVETYFSTSPDRLLSLNLFEGDGWEKLCGFLGTPVPAIPFPHVKPKSTAQRDR